jgi:exodeoxyribonuclease VII small subunit
MKTNTPTTYTSAFAELQQIVSEIERGEINVDELSEKVKRASELLSFCKEKLTQTEGSVASILQDLEKPTENNV